MRRRELKIAQIRPEILREIARKYGTDAGPADAIHWLPYNNASHAIGVESFGVHLAKRLAEAGEIPPEHAADVQLAALVHDIEQDLGTHDRGPDPSHGANERASAERGVAELRNVLWNAPDLFDDEDLRVVTEGVGATRAEVTDQGVTQAVRSPSVMGEGGGQFHAVQEILADADLSSIGRRHGVHRALLLLAQREHRRGLSLPADIDGLANVNFDPATLSNWIVSNISFFESHTWWRPECAELLDPGREANVRAFRGIHEQLIRDLDAGVPSGIAYVTALDDAKFYRAAGRLPEPGEVAPRELPPSDADFPVENRLPSSPAETELAGGMATKPASHARERIEVVSRRRMQAGVMLTDMVDSVSHQAGMTAEEMHRFEEGHRALVARATEEHGGAVIGDRGDGFLVVFESASGAVAGAESLQRALADDAARGGTPIQVRVGLGYGEIVVTHSNAKGRPVHEASRLCDVARPGEIAMSQAVLDAAGESALELTAGRTVELRGLGPTMVYSATLPEPVQPGEGHVTSVDPAPVAPTDRPDLSLLYEEPPTGGLPSPGESGDGGTFGPPAGPGPRDPGWI